MSTPALAAADFERWREPELILSPDSYKSRRLASSTIPGALVREIAFTL